MYRSLGRWSTLMPTPPGSALHFTVSVPDSVPVPTTKAQPQTQTQAMHQQSNTTPDQQLNTHSAEPEPALNQQPDSGQPDPHPTTIDVSFLYPIVTAVSTPRVMDSSSSPTPNPTTSPTTKIIAAGPFTNIPTTLPPPDSAIANATATATATATAMPLLDKLDNLGLLDTSGRLHRSVVVEGMPVGALMAKVRGGVQRFAGAGGCYDAANDASNDAANDATNDAPNSSA